MYAEIAVNRPVHQTFHYHIPDYLVGQLVVGHMVEVSFGTALMTGVIISFSQESPFPRTKPIRRCLAAEPVLTALQLEIAWWIAETTLTPIGICIWLMLPPGLVGGSQTRYSLVDEDYVATTPSQKRIVSLLRNRGELSNHQLNRALPKMNWQSSINVLIKKGVVEREAILKPPVATPKTVRSVKLGIPRQVIPVLATQLGRESRRAAVLEVLQTAENQRLSLKDTMDAAGCGEAPIRTLRDDGAVQFLPQRNWVELAIDRDVLRQELEAGDFDKKSAQKPALEELLATQKAVRRETLDASTSILNTLEKTGYIRQWYEPQSVQLTLKHDEVKALIIELRGGQIYLDILNYLAQKPHAYFPLKQVVDATGTGYPQIRRLAEDELIIAGDTEVFRDPLSEQDIDRTLPPPLTRGQQQVWEPIRNHLIRVNWQGDTPDPDTPHVFLLHGVTGSGKTEIYMRAVAETLAQGRQAIILVPEIALTTQLSARFAARFPDQVSVIHSGLSIGERYDTWRQARDGELPIILGARSALFTPMPDVGLIVLDEEHDDSYKQSPPINAPYYHAREVAIEMMRRNNGTVILGSATPDVSTMFRAEQDEFVLLDLPNRVMAHRAQILEQTRLLNLREARYMPTETTDALGAELPPVEVVDMRHELRTGNRSIFSRKLQDYLRYNISSPDEQAILFLNRRGTSTFVMCRNCGYIAKCPNCDTALTYHASQQQLRCHHCGHQDQNPMLCPDCGSDRIRYFGSGTELIDRMLKEHFPQTRVLRWDQDTASEKGAHERILKAFMNREADILIGTQMIAKGLDIPLVTLVGVISADTALGFPDYRTNERTFQLLTQVAGRAGRGLKPGRVIFQTYQPEHYAIETASRHDYFDFYDQEIQYRRDYRYPPYQQLARVLLTSRYPDQVEIRAREITKILQDFVNKKQFTSTEIIGPTPCFFGRREQYFRWQILIRSADVVRFLTASNDHIEGNREVNVVVDIQPSDLL